MLRKIINIITIFVLLFTTTGITISKHFCGDMLVSFAVDGMAKSCCKAGCKCCHTENVSILLKSDFVAMHMSLKCDVPDYDYPFTGLPVYILSIIHDELFLKPEFTGSPPFQKTKSSRSFLQTLLC